jgi:hypothetical protein
MHLSSLENGGSNASEIDGPVSSPEPDQRDNGTMQSITNEKLSQVKTETKQPQVSPFRQWNSASWVPTQNREVIERLNNLTKAQQQWVSKVISLNCQAACFEFYGRNSLWRTKFTDKEPSTARKLFHLDAQGNSPKGLTDFSLSEWIAKFRHAFVVRSHTNANDGINSSAIENPAMFCIRLELAE